MPKKSDALPEVFLSHRDTSAAVSRLVRDGAARKIGPRLYTRNLADTPEAVVARNVWPITALLAPGAVVSHRTAFENRPAPDGSVFLSGAYPRQIALPGITLRQIALPGITLRQIESHGPLTGDMPFMGSLYLASRPRAFLENLSPSRRRERVAKAVERAEVERRLAELLRSGGEEALNRLRDEARALTPEMGAEDQFRLLESLIGALLRSRPSSLTSDVARAYAAGELYDPQRLPTLSSLLAALRSQTWPRRPDRAAAPLDWQNAAFFNAYFSNYIEGTDFLWTRPSESSLRARSRPVGLPMPMTCWGRIAWLSAGRRWAAGRATLTTSWGCCGIGMRP